MKGLEAFIQPVACESCPFNETGPGRHLRNSLGPGRFDSILADLRQEKSFPCHKTATDKRWTKKARICAGALAWQRQNNCVPQAVQVAERLTALREGRKARL